MTANINNAVPVGIGFVRDGQTDPTRMLAVNSDGSINVTGTISASSSAEATAAAPSYADGTSEPFSQNLTGDLRVIAKVQSGQVIGIDQTTPGTTNAVDVTNLPSTLDVNTGNATNDTVRVVLASNQPAVSVSDASTHTSLTTINTTLGSPLQAGGTVVAENVGHTGATFDATLTAGTAPTNGLAVISLYESSAPAPTSGQTLALQSSPNGNILTQPYRRSQIGSATGSINSVTPATLIAAQGAGIFADITNLILSLSAETTAAIIQVIVSDGTKTYNFGFDVETVANASASHWDIPFNPYLPASTANTAWTIALSAADGTVQFTAIFANQTANF